MPENDFIHLQIRQDDARTALQKGRDFTIIFVSELVLFSIFMYWLTIDTPIFMTIYLFLFAACVILARKHSSVQKYVSLFEKNKNFASSVAFILSIFYPFVFKDSPYLVFVGAMSGVYIIMALGLNITLGYAGLLDLGYAAYFAAGAYTSSQLSVLFGLNFWMCMVIGGFVAAVLGFSIAWPALRVADQYLALVTLGFGLIMNLLHRNIKFLTNGNDGVINIPAPTIAGFDFYKPLVIGSIKLPFQANFYFLTLILIVIIVVVSLRMRDSKVGRALEAIREDQIAAKCFGISLVNYKILAFATGAFFGGISGSVFAHMIGFIHPDNFVFWVSMTVVCMVIIGGMGNIFGVIVGAIFLVVLPEKLREFARHETAYIRRLYFSYDVIPAPRNFP